MAYTSESEANEELLNESEKARWTAVMVRFFRIRYAYRHGDHHGQ